jgi:hypothetical protein
MDVLQHYNTTPTIIPLPLGKNELIDLQSFLLTLNDVNFVFNKKFGYPLHTTSRK